MTNDNSSVSSDEVKKFLQNEEGIALDLKAEDLGLQKAAPEAETKQQTVIPPDTSYSDGNVGAKMIAEMLRTPKLSEKDLLLSNYEKEIYLKAMMDDLPVFLDIELPGIKATVRVRSRNNFEQTLISHAINRDLDAKLLPDFSAHVTRSMQYSAMFQLVRFNGKPIPHLEFDTPVSIEEGVQKMQSMLPHYGSMSGPKWNVYLTALQIFEGKLALAGTSILNKDFFQPAG